MSRVVLDAAGREVEGEAAVPPRRVTLSGPELDRLSALCGCGSPAAELTSRGGGALARMADRLDGGAAPGRQAREPGAPQAAPVAAEDVDPALRARGLLGDDGVPEEVATALRVWHEAELGVELELRLSLRAGPARVRSWHRHRGDWVVCVSTADGLDFELAWMEPTSWPHELVRVALVDPHRMAPVVGDTLETEVLPAVLETPWELLLGTGEAVAAGRLELLPELAAGFSDLTTYARQPGGEPAAAADEQVVGWHHALEHDSRGRLHAAVSGRSGRGRPGIGVVEWVLLGDGWRSLTPFTRKGWRMVRIEAVSPLGLPRAVAALAGEVTT